MTIACRRLLSGLSDEQRVFSDGDVTAALENDALRNALKGFDALTDDESECALDSMVIWLTIGQGGFSPTALEAQFDKHRVTVNLKDLDRSLARLQLAFILRRDGDRYVYRVPLFLDMLRTVSLPTMQKKAVASYTALSRQGR